MRPALRGARPAMARKQRGLAGTGGPDHQGMLPGFELEIDRPQDARRASTQSTSTRCVHLDALSYGA